MVRCQNYKHCIKEGKTCKHIEEHIADKYEGEFDCTKIPCQDIKFIKYDYTCEDVFLLKVKERINDNPHQMP